MPCLFREYPRKRFALRVKNAGQRWRVVALFNSKEQAAQSRDRWLTEAEQGSRASVTPARPADRRAVREYGDREVSQRRHAALVSRRAAYAA